MTEQHTRGPWKVVGTIHGNYIIGAYAPGNEEAGVLRLADTTRGRPEADAWLMAAAPDLLEALRFSVSVHRAQGLIDLSERMAVEKGEAAIRKAEGPTAEGG